MQTEKMPKLHYAETVRAHGLATPERTVVTTTTAGKAVQKFIVI